MQLEVADSVFQSFAFFSAILVVKMLLMSLLTARQRFSKKVFANPEDVAHDKKAKVEYGDVDVERVRRAHQNDLENILPFFVIGLLYCFTHPDPGTANLLFKIVAGGRILHTLVYAVFVIPQPARFLAFAAGLGPTLYMAVKVLMYFA
ncbi:Microsomal glutathione S-transferase 1 [Orchesella cincta]|uniref:Microsomal glutathione S-transferase 1 n=1 Tax=Orchesella cincta TaxID=48709 RepID=A0A1D2NKR4_ORCCI|nr:Microsomal glutathione S-transferase 1 [Orchesella cincta]